MLQNIISLPVTVQEVLPPLQGHVTAIRVGAEM